MTERKYSVSEVDELRHLMDNKYLYGSYNMPPNGGASRSYLEGEKAKVVEEMVRTAMFAGHVAEDFR